MALEQSIWFTIDTESDYHVRGCANGYVAIPHNHPLYMATEESLYQAGINLNAPGGVTFSRQAGVAKETLPDFPEDIPDDWWVLGFDTAHFGMTPVSWPKQKCIRATLDFKESIDRYAE